MKSRATVFRVRRDNEKTPSISGSSCKASHSLLCSFCLQIISFSSNAYYSFAGDLDLIAAMAMQALRVLSSAQNAFAQRFSNGLVAVIRVLEHSITSALGTLQEDTLVVLSRGMSDRPGIISAARAEYLMILFKKLFCQYENVLKEHAISDTAGYGLSPEGLNAACEALIHLLQAPSCPKVHSFSSILQNCLSSALSCIKTDASYGVDYNGVRFATRLLRESFLFFHRQSFDDISCKGGWEVLLELCSSHLVPVCTATIVILDEGTVLTVFSTFSLILHDEGAVGAASFAKKLASEFWFSLAFSTMCRFPLKLIKETVYEFVSIMLERLTSCGDLIRNVVAHLPTDPEDLLVLLEQHSGEDSQIIATHQAIIALISTSRLHDDRLECYPVLRLLVCIEPTGILLVSR